ncbi:MAG: GNAT family N-acetyltransferase [Ruminococcus sp.]|nr:GNAT family N-acetyltransferase [Ruminococcus sp.]
MSEIPKLTGVRIAEYASDEELEALSRLADEIWHECYADIITDKQIDYMIDKYQSAAAMKAQIEDEGYHYFVLEIDGVPSGYFGLQKLGDTGDIYAADGIRTMFLSKFYLRRELRGKGFGSQMFREIKRFTRKNGCELIKLTVNRNNVHAINVYKHIGMRVIDEKVTDIGEGFVMDDYIFGIMI